LIGPEKGDVSSEMTKSEWEWEWEWEWDTVWVVDTVPMTIKKS